MTWGRSAIEMLFGGPRECDLCRHPAIAFHAGYSRCEDHLTEEMIRFFGSAAGVGKEYAFSRSTDSKIKTHIPAPSSSPEGRHAPGMFPRQP